MKILIKSFSVLMLLTLISSSFYSCQGTDGLCYANLDFEVTDPGDCGPNQHVGFELKFVSKYGDEILKSYVIPSAVQSHVIALPPAETYDVYMRNNGVQNGCAGAVYFDMVISDPDDNEECFRIEVSADERPGIFLNPIASFFLGETCDNCPTITKE